MLTLSIDLPRQTANAADDRFLAGLATAVLELEFGLTDVEVVVENGRLVLDPQRLGGRDPEAVRAALDGLHGLEVRLERHADAPVLRIAEDDRLPSPASPAAPDEAALILGLFPEQELFEPPIADPRSPAISAGVISYFDDPDFERVGRVDFGGSLPLYGWQMADGLWQAGIQGGVFSVFDLERSSSELINADYLVALPLEARWGDLSSRLRLLHLSSHLGDEFLLRTEADRVNLSYEALDLLLAYDFFDMLRLYGGGSALLRRTPSDLDTWGVQGGAEIMSPQPLLGSIVYPLAALDVRSFEETGWDPGVSIKAGVELRNGFLSGTRVQLLAEYFNGRSPNGQLYEREIEFAGIGFRVLF